MKPQFISTSGLLIVLGIATAFCAGFIFGQQYGYKNSHELLAKTLVEADDVINKFNHQKESFPKEKFGGGDSKEEVVENSDNDKLKASYAIYHAEKGNFEKAHIIADSINNELLKEISFTLIQERKLEPVN